MGDSYLFCLGLTLTGYALDGRGFAYLGVPPLFIGEFMLLLGIVVLIGTRHWATLWQCPPVLALTAFILLGVARTIPYVDTLGMDALRDAAIYYYSVFALIVAGLLISKPQRLVTLIGYYRSYAKIFVVIIPVVAAVYRFSHDALPHWPWGDVPMIQEKEGDVMVHLGGIIAFWMSGLAGLIPTPWAILLALDAACMGVIDRAGIVSFSAAMGLGMGHNPRGPIGWKMLGGLLAAVVLLAVTGIHIEIPGGKGRDISFDQIAINVRSMVGDAGNDGLDSTKEWRTDWWKDIIADTFHGKYFWTGKGFGINLADEYGYQVLQDHSLRSPHSAHMTVLARMGVPGLLLWAMVQGIWAISVLRAYVESRRNDEKSWASLFLFLGAFWLAFLINCSFDVFLEGPMGGIWFWTVYGTGIASLWIYKHKPQVMLAGANTDQLEEAVV